MRTTLDLDDELLAEAKALAAHKRLTLTRLIEEGLALRLRRDMPVQAGRGARWPHPRRGGSAAQHRPAGCSRWPAAALLARRECLATFDRDFLPLLPSCQLLLLEK